MTHPMKHPKTLTKTYCMKVMILENVQMKQIMIETGCLIVMMKIVLTLLRVRLRIMKATTPMAVIRVYLIQIA